MGVFNMGSVPRDRRKQAMLRRQLGQDLPVAVFRFGPVPLPPPVTFSRTELEDFRDEIDGEPELVRALPRARFRGAFGEKVVLPVGTAQTLERFEAELRAVGLIRKGQVLRQGAKLKSHFRVQVVKGERSSLDVHEFSSLKNAHSGPVRGVGERANKLRRSEPKPLLEPVQAKGHGVQRKRCVRVKGGLPPT